MARDRSFAEEWIRALERDGYVTTDMYQTNDKGGVVVPYKDQDYQTVEEHRFSVPSGIEEVWSVMSDSPQIASLFPSLNLECCDSESLTGTVTVYCDQISATFRGTVTFVRRDRGKRKVVAEGNAQDECGHTVCLKVTASLTPVGDLETNVDLAANIRIMGRETVFTPRVLESGALEELGSKLLNEFSTGLATTLTNIAGPKGGENALFKTASPPTDSFEDRCFVEESANHLHRSKLDNIFEFTTAIARIEAEKTLSAHSQAMAVLRQLEVTLSQLWSEGELSEYVENELIALTRVSLDAIQHLSGEFGSALESLTRRYEPPVTMRERILHWWETLFRPRLG